jgi:hypothetical protein
MIGRERRKPKKSNGQMGICWWQCERERTMWRGGERGFCVCFPEVQRLPLYLSLSLSCKAFCVSEALPRWLCAILAYVFIEERDVSEVTDILISIHLSLTMKGQKKKKKLTMKEMFFLFLFFF